MNTVMNPSVETLIKALKTCAEAHGAEFCDWSEEECQVALKKESVPVLSDVKMICEAFLRPIFHGRDGLGLYDRLPGRGILPREGGRDAPVPRPSQERTFIKQKNT